MQVTDHVHMLRIDFTLPVAPDRSLDRFVNAFVIDDRDLCLVDAGVAGSAHDILGCVRGLGRDPTDTDRLVLTHAHPDHIGAAAATSGLSRKYRYISLDFSCWAGA